MKKEEPKFAGAIVDKLSLRVSKYYFGVFEWSYWDKNPWDMLEYFKSVFDEVPSDKGHS
jgi:hypothetical protein